MRTAILALSLTALTFCSGFSGCLSPGSETDSSESTPEPDSQQQSKCAELIDGQPIGLACIHCAHPNAHAQALVLADIVRDSCRRRLAVNYLIDGRFGYDDSFVAEHISKLAADRELTVIFYLTNGAAQRRRDTSAPNEFASGIGPEEFRRRILNDTDFREGYRQIVRRAMLIKTLSPVDVAFILIPGLEDNMPDWTFQNVLSLTKEVAGNEVSYGRNPCLNCYDDNGSYIPPGVIEESHPSGFYSGTAYGIVFTDGRSYTFSTEPSSETPLSALTALRNDSQNSANIFLLWTGKYQGVVSSGDRIVLRPPPDERTYATPSAAEISALISFLHG